MKRKLVCMMLAAAVTAGSLAGCGSQSGESSGGDQQGSDSGQDAGDSQGVDASGGFEGDGRVINIYSWNDEFRERIEAVYPELEAMTSTARISPDSMGRKSQTASGKERYVVSSSNVVVFMRESVKASLM